MRCWQPEAPETGRDGAWLISYWDLEPGQGDLEPGGRNLEPGQRDLGRSGAWPMGTRPTESRRIGRLLLGAIGGSVRFPGLMEWPQAC